MTRPRPELVRGLLVLLGFVGLVIMSDLFITDYYSTSEYDSVKPEVLVSSPERFEGELISTTVRVSEVHNHPVGLFYIVETVEGITLLSPISLGSIDREGDVIVRGRSLLTSSGYIEVVEFYILDSNIAILRSIPGLIVFVVVFYLVFRIDFERLAFVPRRVQDA